jgi:hypothetical protein
MASAAAPNNSGPPDPQQSAPPQQTGTNSNSTVRTAPAWPADLPLAERYISDPNWPANLRLDLGKMNWDEWSHRMGLVAQRQGFRFWLDGTYAQPDLATSPGRHYTWQLNDDSLRAFLLHNISHAECKLVENLPTSCAVWASLKARHQKRGLYAQLTLIKQVLEIRFSNSTPLEDTLEKIDDLITQISNMGSIDWDKFKSVVLINALGGDLEHIQSQLHGVADDPGFSTNTIVRRIRHEADLEVDAANASCVLTAGALGTVLIFASLRAGSSPGTRSMRPAPPNERRWASRTIKSHRPLVAQKPRLRTLPHLRHHHVLCRPLHPRMHRIPSSSTA